MADGVCGATDSVCRGQSRVDNRLECVPYYFSVKEEMLLHSLRQSESRDKFGEPALSLEIHAVSRNPSDDLCKGMSFISTLAKRSERRNEWASALEHSLPSLVSRRCRQATILIVLLWRRRRRWHEWPFGTAGMPNNLETR